MFELTKEQRMVEQVFRRFAEKEILPVVPQLESGELLPYDLMRKMQNELMGGPEQIRESVLRRAERLEKGEGAQMSPEEAIESDPLFGSIISKELCRVAPGFCMSWGASRGLFAGNVMSRGTPEQIRRYALPVQILEKIGAWGLTEPGAGSDAIGGMRTTARVKGDHYVLSGSKTFITNAPYADYFLIYAKVDRGQPPDERRAHAFIVERGMKGLSTGRPFVKMGMKDSPTGEVFLDEVEVPRENILGGGEKQGGRSEVVSSLGSERSGVCPMCLGITEKCYELSLAYARERVQFGRPIGHFQAVQLKLADMYINLQNSWDIIFRLAWMAKTGKRDLAYSCAAKVYTARAAVQTSLDAIQIHGGYGYMQEYHVEKLMRDAKLLEIGAGTTDINAMTTARAELGLI
jgi:hypothetical protein